jgi:iron complex outermembrane recepter protein
VAVLHNKKIAGIITCLLAGFSYQVAADDSKVFKLGEIQVTAPKDQDAGVVSETLDIEDIRKFNRETVGSALNLLPGVTLSNNSRNEQMISVRAYDPRQVPLFIDGIPVYVPYDGYVDFGRFTTSDLSAIQLSKGYSSVSFGPNTLGGAINLVSRKPTKAFEGDARIGFGQQNTHEANFNVGTNQGTWYFQAGGGYRDSDGFRLSDDFKPTATENGGERENSKYKDSKISLKFGITPNETDEYAISYYKQNGEKGNPPSTALAPTAVRYWDWPQWDKESLYFISKTALSQHEAIKVRLFVDEFDNTLRSYTNATYSVLRTSGNGSVNNTGTSIYHDKTHGATIELESTRISNNTLRLFAHYKVDEHENPNGIGVNQEAFKDTFRSLSFEDAVKIGDKTIVTFGFAHHELSPDKVFKLGQTYALPKNQTADDPQIALSYQLSPTATLYTSAAQKTRLPTLKDRYSGRLGTYVANPALGAERAHNYEIGYKGNPWAGAMAQVALFQNEIDDKIQDVILPTAPATQTSCSNGATNSCQVRNVGEFRIRGIELSLDTPIGDYWEVGGNYTKMDINNRFDNTRLLYVPERKITLHATWKPLDSVRVIGFAENNSSRWTSNTFKVDSFTIMNLKAAWQPVKNLTAEVGVNNIADKNYFLDAGFPNPGRMWFTNLSYLF